MITDEQKAVEAAVRAGLRALGAEVEPKAPAVWDVRLPPHLRSLFGHKLQHRLVLDYEVWQSDRTATLIAPGSRFLEQLEEALSPGRGELFGGELLPNHQVLEEWLEDVAVLNATPASDQSASASRFEKSHLLIYEIQIPGPPSTTEVLPVVWDGTTQKFLAADAARSIQETTWFSPYEVSALLPDPENTSQREWKRVASAADKEVQRRVGPLVARSRAVREADLEEERQRLEADLRARLREAADNDDNKLEKNLEEEFRRRSELLDRRAAGEATARRLVHVALHRGRVRYAAGLIRSDGRRCEVALPSQAGIIREDLCAWCDEPRAEYLVDPGLDTGLACTTCAGDCRIHDCVDLVPKQQDAQCPECDTPRYCEAHHRTCKSCLQPRCEEHVFSCSEVGCTTNLCSEHILELPGMGLFCSMHAILCQAGGELMRKAEGHHCPITHKWTCSAHGVRPDGDTRLLHPDAVVKCATSGDLIAKDRADRCDPSGRWHRAELLHKSEATGKPLCAKHRQAVRRPEGWQVEHKRVRECAETGWSIDESVAASCSVSGDLCFEGALVTCPLSHLKLRQEHAIQPPGDDRHLHPSKVVFSVLSSEPVAVDRAVFDELSFEETLPIAPSEAQECEFSGKLAARRFMVRANCCDRLMAKRFLRRIEDGSVLVCEDHLVFCSHDNEPKAKQRTAECQLSGERACHDHLRTAACCDRVVSVDHCMPSDLSGRTVCTEHAIECPLLGGAVLPEEATTCELSGRAVSLPQAVRSRCGRTVGRDRAVLVGDNDWGCDEHFGACSAGEPLPVAELSRCSHCGSLVCATHASADCSRGLACASHFEPCSHVGCGESICTEHGNKGPEGTLYCEDHALFCDTCDGWLPRAEFLTCSCHELPQHRRHLERDPFNRSRWVCDELMIDCGSCRQRSQGDKGAGFCAPCLAIQSLSDVDEAKHLFKRLVRPKLGLLGVRRKTRVVGGPSRYLFVVDLYPKKQRLFLVDIARDAVKEI